MAGSLVVRASSYNPITGLSQNGIIDSGDCSLVLSAQFPYSGLPLCWGSSMYSLIIILTASGQSASYAMIAGPMTEAICNAGNAKFLTDVPPPIASRARPMCVTSRDNADATLKHHGCWVYRIADDPDPSSNDKVWFYTCVDKQPVH
jgi:hypothetical protein